MMRLRKGLLVALFGPLLLIACGGEEWRTKDISGLVPDLEFALTDEQGRAVRAADYRGRIALLFFGYTYCPDVCPATMARLSTAVAALGPGAHDELRVLFVSVDPARDTPEHLRRYTDYFGDSVIGLTGDKPALDALTKRYRVTYGYGDKDADGNYSVSHASGVFVFGREGEPRLLLRESDTQEAVQEDLRRLLSERG